jgi:hypothetical protein
MPILTPFLQQMLGLSLGFAAVVSTVGNLGRAIAAALGPWLLGAAYSLSGSFHTMWLLLGSLLACGFPVALLVPTPRTAAGKGAVAQTGGRRHVRSLEHRPGQLFRRKHPNDQ